jgi:hypothetical protein
MLLFNEDLTGGGVIKMVVMEVMVSFYLLSQGTLRAGLRSSGRVHLVLVAIGLVQSMHSISSLFRLGINIYHMIKIPHVLSSIGRNLEFSWP